MSKIIKITQIRSAIGRLPRHRKILYGLGLGRIGKTVEKVDTVSIRGMIDVISYMLKVE